MLSTEAGAWAELGDAAIGISPFDLVATAEAIGAALDGTDEERARRADRLRALVAERTPADWLDDQIAAAR